MMAHPAYAADRFEETIAAAKAAMQLQPEEGVALARKARAIASHNDRTRRPVRQAEAEWLEGEAYSRLMRSDLAWPLLSSALRTALRHMPESSLVADILLAHGNVSVDTGRVATALNDFQRAYQLFVRQRNTRGQTKVLIELALLHHEARDSATALKYFIRAAEIEQADPGVAVAIHNGLGNELRDLHRYEESRIELERAITLARRMNSPLLTATVLNNAARTAIAMNRLPNAERLVEESFHESGVSVARSFRDQQLAIAADIAANRGRDAEAAILLRSVFSGVDLTRNTLTDRDAHRVAVGVYRRLGRHRLAFEHLTALKRLDDDATAIARSYSAALVGARFDFASQEARIARLKALDLQKTIAFERARAQTDRIIFVGAAGGAAVLVALLAFLLFTMRRSRDRLVQSNLALAKALAARTEFLATTSHEIRTPLNGILGMTQVMLADRGLAAEVRERVSLVHTAGQTMRALVDDILDAAKIEAGKLVIEHVAFDLCATIGEGCRLWEAQARAKGLSFTVVLHDCPSLVIGDRGRVRQVMSNLLGNAVKFTASGAISVTAARHGARYRIDVADTGEGIPADKLETVFESFRQADTTTTRRFGGTGLGLAISRSIARTLGGNVTVQSTPGEGSCFTIDLPLIEASAAAEAVEPPAAPCSLLIVEANPIARAMLRALFDGAGEMVTAVDMLDAALTRLEEGGVEKVLVDEATLALGDRWAALAALAAAKRGARLCVTWPSRTSGFDELADRGVDQPIAKPLTREALVAAVRRSEAQPLESCAA